VHEFSRVDWSRVNLDEWLAILFETGHFPTTDKLNLENLTGTGSVLSGGNRGNAVDRSIGRTTGLDAEQTRRDAEAELWSDALPNLP
jgi:conjugal transfer mating pair stabilization protein TraN